MSLAGSHALVTGASGGIGGAIAFALAAAGARVSLAGRKAAALSALAHGLGGNPGATAVFDVTDEKAVGEGVAAVRAAAGPIHILINNAGTARSASFAQTDGALWSQMLAVNLTGSYLVTRAVAGEMLTRRAGRIVNIASTAGLAGYPYVSAYVAAKHGLVGLTRALALEFGRQGVTVNAVCPGYTQTDMLERTVENIVSKTGRSDADARAELTRWNPQGRLIQAREVAEAVGWLCLPSSASITGQAIAIAGGETV
jgi:NAD(P)-dependent dehydrogenase (short-subunit alcohol dehydrogenase family)